MTKDLQADGFDKRTFYKTVCALVLPMAAQNLINVAVTSADVFMLGKVSETALSGASLAGQVQFIMMLIFFGLTSGACVLTAQYWGKGDTRTIEKVLGIALRFSLSVATFFVLAVLIFAEPIMHIFTSETDVIAEGVIYLRIIVFSYYMMAFTMIYLNICRSIERVLISTAVLFISLMINIALNTVLIFGVGSIPAMGIKGAAIATVAARAVETTIVIIYSKKVNKTIRLRLSDIISTGDKPLFADFMKYSLPVMLNELMWGGGVAMNSVIIGHLGKTVVAANSVAQNARQLATVVTFGLASAAAIIIGKAIGENKPALAEIYAKKLLQLCLVMGLLGAAVILLIRSPISAFMNLSEQSREYLGMMMLVMSYFVVCQSVNTVIIVGILRAGGDTKFGLLLDVTTMWGCSIFIGFLAAFVLKLDVTTVYIILMSDEIIKIPLSLLRFRSKKWIKNVTR